MTLATGQWARVRHAVSGSTPDGSLPLDGRRALITGAASGIGRACAQRLRALGAEVIVADRDGEGAATVADALGGEAWVVDLADLGVLEGENTAVDVLVNNAGIQHVAPLPTFSPESPWPLAGPPRRRENGAGRAATSAFLWPRGRTRV